MPFDKDSKNKDRRPGKFSKGGFKGGGFKKGPKDKFGGGKKDFGDKSRDGDKPRSDRPFSKGKPFKGKPRDERSRDDRPRSDKPRSDRPRSEGPRGDRPWADKSRAQQPRGDKFRPRRDDRDRPERDRPDDRKRFDRPRFEKSHGDKPRFEKSRGDKPRFDKPRGENPRFDKPRPEAGPRPNIYGFHAVREAWLNPARRFDALYVTDNAGEGFEETLIEARAKGLDRPAPIKTDRHRLETMLPRAAVHQGVAALVRPLEEIFVQDLIVQSSGRPKTVLVMLDQVTDPHNVGAILRSACAFGATGVIMQRVHAPEMEGVLAKTASGAVEHVPVIYETNLSRALEQLKERGFFVYGLDERGEKTVGEMKGDKIVLVLGAEGSGLRRLVKENCDELVKLPTAGPIQSLNVSNAAAIALYAALTS